MFAKELEQVKFSRQTDKELFEIQMKETKGRYEKKIADLENQIRL
jgi:hypothetical protein